MSWRGEAGCSRHSPKLTGDTGRPRTPPKSQIHHAGYTWATKLPTCSRRRSGLLGRLQPTDSNATLVCTMCIKKHFTLEIKTYTAKLHFLDNYYFWIVLIFGISVLRTRNKRENYKIQYGILKDELHQIPAC